MADLPDVPLPAGIRSRYVDGINGLRMHVLEAGFETKGRPCILLLHGFPELAFSWRKVMPALASAGYHVIAPDQRGYGRTTGWTADYDGDLTPFSLLNLVRDALALVSAFGYRQVDLAGHDFGSPVAAWCALIRPDVFRSVTLMSAPFGGAPPMPFGTVDSPAKPPAEDPVHRELAALPRPRKHYQWYYATRPANADMQHAPQGVHDFLRAYYHQKSADWTDNKPYPLTSWSAGELAKLPTYYVMDAGETMAETVAKEMPSPAAIAANQWLPDSDLAYYSAEYGRTGFQGACNGTATAPRACSTARCSCLRAAALTCPPASSRASRIGAPISAPACSKRCRGAAARRCSVAISSTAPAIGCSRNSRPR